MLIDSIYPASDTFWKSKRVIVTGGAGFLGSFLTEKLQARGAAEIIIPHIEQYNLVKAAPLAPLTDAQLKEYAGEYVSEELLNAHKRFGV